MLLLAVVCVTAFGLGYESLWGWRAAASLGMFFGNGAINTAQTVFGYENTPLTGTLSFPNPQTGGCRGGDTLQGSFSLNGSAGRCSGTVTVTWQSNEEAFIAWDIANAGPNCPTTTNHWEINTYPVAL
ncbi:MAG: hypothetical protein HC857_14295 [Synechococcales cyanobacterium RU_4_20]|nr:hypothetical protein [Synechococcales cyanobacterium RU_4_20]